MKKSINFNLFLIMVSLILLQACGNNGATNKANKTLADFAAKIKEKPSDASLYYKRGQYYQLIEKDSLAIVDFIKAVDLDSTKAVYYSTAADILFDKKDPRSIGFIKKAIALNPNDVVALTKIATMQLYTKNYPDAFKSINTVLRIDVYNYDAYFLKGMCYKDMGDTISAMSSFKTASQISPDVPAPLMQLAMLSKDEKQSLLYYENAFNADTNNVEALNGIGMIHQQNKNLPEAKKAFIRCITAKPGYAKAYYNMGCIAMDEDSIEKAQRQFDIAIKNEPQYVEAFYNRGLCKEMMNDALGALKDYEQALMIDADFQLAVAGKKRLVK
jgi:tetratricopeptide (TPR) repeat protein